MKSRSSWLTVSFGVIGLTVTAGRELAVVTIPVALALLTLALNGPRERQPPRRLLFIIITTFGVLSLAGPIHPTYGNPPRALFAAAGIVWLTISVVWYAWRGSKTAYHWILAVSLTATAGLGAWHILATGGFGLDVLQLHRAAADAIASGVSPYAEAVTFPSGAPDGPRFIVGYPYPPTVALAYAASEWLFSDPRWLSLGAWLLTLAVLGRPRPGDPENWMPLGVMVALAALPGWPHILTSGWTEPLTLAIFVLVAEVWRSRPWSGALLGAAIATKQYLAVLAPLVVLPGRVRKGGRLTWLVAAGALSVVPGLFWGVSDFVDATIRFHLEMPPRIDGTSLPGLLDLFGISWSVPTWVMAAVVVVVGFEITRKVIDRETVMIASSIVLATTFVLSVQAFPNYWFLVTGLIATGLCASSGVPGRESVDRSTDSKHPA